MTGSVVAPTTDVVDEAAAAADGVRKTARWIASAFGGIPSLAILSSLVRAPGDTGYDPTRLALGVGLAALGAVLAVLAFARVMAPVPLEDKDLSSLDLKRIPGQPYTGFADLDRDMTDLRTAAVAQEYRAAQSLRTAQRAKGEAENAEATASEAERAATATPDDATLARQAKAARQLADVARHMAAAKEAAAADRAGQAVWDEQLARRDAIRAKAYRLKASDEVGRRYRHALIAAAIATALIATGIVLLGLAPKPKAAAAISITAHHELASSWNC